MRDITGNLEAQEDAEVVCVLQMKTGQVRHQGRLAGGRSLTRIETGSLGQCGVK